MFFTPGNQTTHQLNFWKQKMKPLRKWYRCRIYILDFALEMQHLSQINRDQNQTRALTKRTQAQMILNSAQVYPTANKLAYCLTIPKDPLVLIHHIIIHKIWLQMAPYIPWQIIIIQEKLILHRIQHMRIWTIIKVEVPTQIRLMITSSVISNRKQLWIDWRIVFRLLLIPKKKHLYYVSKNMILSTAL